MLKFSISYSKQYWSSTLVNVARLNFGCICITKLARYKITTIHSSWMEELFLFSFFVQCTKNECTVVANKLCAVNKSPLPHRACWNVAARNRALSWLWEPFSPPRLPLHIGWRVTSEESVVRLHSIHRSRQAVFDWCKSRLASWLDTATARGVVHLSMLRDWSAPVRERLRDRLCPAEDKKVSVMLVNKSLNKNGTLENHSTFLQINCNISQKSTWTEPPATMSHLSWTTSATCQHRRMDNWLLEMTLISFASSRSTWSEQTSARFPCSCT